MPHWMSQGQPRLEDHIWLIILLSVRNMPLGICRPSVKGLEMFPGRKYFRHGLSIHAEIHQINSQSKAHLDPATAVTQ